MPSNLRTSIVMNVGVKVLALFASLASTPLMIAFFSNDSVLGAWFTILSVLNWISFFDFGIGNGLRNDLTYALASGDVKKGKEVVSSSICLLLFVVFLLLPVGILVSSSVDWNTTFSVKDGLVEGEKFAICMTVVICGTLVQLVFKLVNSLCYAAQHNVMPAVLLLVSNVLILAAVAFPPVLADYGDKLIYMSVIEVGFLSLPLLVAAIVLFAGDLREYRPKPRYVKKSYFGSIGSLGLQFFAIQIALLFVSSTNELFIGWICGSEDVVSYSVAYKVFNLMLVFFGVMAQPIWSDMAASYAAKDLDRLSSVHSKYIRLAFVVSLGVLVLGMAINPILSAWLSSQAPSLSLIESAALVLLVGVTVLTNAETCLGNATNRLAPQVVCYAIAAVAKYPLSIGLSYFMNGWAAVVISNAIVLVPVCISQHAANAWLTKGCDR